MGKGTLQWQDQPEPQKFVPIISVRLGTPFRGHLAGPVCGVLAHFLDGSSSPCLATDAVPCRLCQIQPNRWKGFIPAETLTGARRIVEITPGVMRKNPWLLKPSPIGCRIELTRRGPTNTSPLIFVRELSLPPRDGIVPFDPRPSILNMWRLGPDGSPLSDGGNGDG